MDTIPYWMLGSPMPPFPSLQQDVTVEVAVIGGGITGITTAYLAKQAGLTVALLERGEFAAVDTGHTTAHLTYVMDQRLPELVQKFGEDHARAAWDAGAAAMEQIRELIDREQIEADFSWVPGFLHAPWYGSAEADSFRQEAELAQRLGFDATYLEEVPFARKPGVLFANQAKFHPRKYLAALVAAIPGKGSHVFGGSAVETIQSEPPLAKANGYTVRCRYLVIATHVPLQGAAGTVGAALFQTKLAPYTSYVVSAKIPAGSVPEASYWDTSDPYYYLRIDRQKGHDYAILGGADHKTGQERDPRRCFAQVEKHLLKILPEAKVDHRWCGQVVETTDGLPYIGEVAPKQFAATGFSGNGMTFGTLAAMMAVDAARGVKNPWSELFAVDRKPPARSVWDYLKENKDYPYYFLKDRLSQSPKTALGRIAPGQGKVIQRAEGKIAAYRRLDGELVLKSALCTHMGCVVRWNAADTTWDCPCHGSRFEPTGEVRGGPAETPLADAPQQ